MHPAGGTRFRTPSSVICPEYLKRAEARPSENERDDHSQRTPYRSREQAR